MRSDPRVTTPCLASGRSRLGPVLRSTCCAPVAALLRPTAGRAAALRVAQTGGGPRFRIAPPADRPSSRSEEPAGATAPRRRRRSRPWVGPSAVTISRPAAGGGGGVQALTRARNHQCGRDAQNRGPVTDGMTSASPVARTCSDMGLTSPADGDGSGAVGVLLAGVVVPSGAPPGVVFAGSTDDCSCRCLSNCSLSFACSSRWRIASRFVAYRCREVARRTAVGVGDGVHAEDGCAEVSHAAPDNRASRARARSGLCHPRPRRVLAGGRRGALITRCRRGYRTVPALRAFSPAGVGHSAAKWGARAQGYHCPRRCCRATLRVIFEPIS